MRQHKDDLKRHFQKASDFLVRCQVGDPYVQKGTLRGSVCPWEIGVLDTHGFTILEDFHDTLEALWVWSYYVKVSDDRSYMPNIDSAWQYIIGNFERFIPPDKIDEGLYDCSLVILSGSQYEQTFRDRRYSPCFERAGNRLARYLQRIRSTRGRAYADPWWMATCLATAARVLRRDDWLEAATRFASQTVIEQEKPFSRIEKERRHRGPGGHDFFSHNANKALALASCFPSKSIARETLARKFLPCAPRGFVKRPIDENPWNANVAAALGSSYLLTDNEDFLLRYFAVMNELKKRDVQNSSALARSEEFPVKESWVTFFYAYAYVSVVR